MPSLRGHRWKVAVGTVLSACLAGGGIAAATVDPGVSDGNNGFAWYPQSHAASGPGQPPDTGDPITLIFRGGGIQPFNAVANYIMYDWDQFAPLPDGVPPLGPWRTHTTNPLCTHSGYLTFRYSGAQSQTVKNSFTGSTSAYCFGNQYHGRFWSDAVHAAQSGQASQQWVVGSVHHDHNSPTHPKHGLDVPWDLARVVFLHALHFHCQYRIWHVNTGARKFYQGLWNSGRISRVSRQTARPCNGA